MEHVLAHAHACQLIFCHQPMKHVNAIARSDMAVDVVVDPNVINHVLAQ
jgi:hypothetical protein